MTARLTAFYALDPWRLLAELPMAVVSGLSRMLPRLEAERSLEASDQVALGIGKAFTAGATKDAYRRWLKALDGGDQAPARGRRGTPEQLAALGIHLIKETPHAG